MLNIGHSSESVNVGRRSERIMKITKLSVYQVDLPLKDGPYNWSDGKSVSTLDSTVLKVETDGGITGYGEVKMKW